MAWRNKFNTCTFEDFVKVFFGKKLSKFSPHFINRRIILPNIRKDVVAEIALDTHGTHGQYECFTVSIIHKDNGVIVSHTFTFKDWLKLPSDSANANSNIPILIGHCGYDWHCDGPTKESIEKMIDAIIEYITCYK